MMRPVMLSLLLLMQSMSLQANNDEEAGAVSNDEVSNKGIELESAIQSKAEQVNSMRKDVPGWPERQHSNRRSKIPPPPPGPYMSTALSARSIHGASFEENRNVDDSELRVEANGESKDRFSPDRPWPSNLRAPSRWKPDNGYQFVGDKKTNKVYTSSMNNRYPTKEAGYRSDARMNHSGNWVRKHPGVSPDIQGRGVQSPESRSVYPAARAMPYQDERYNAYPPGYRGGSNAVYNNPANQPPYPVQGER